MHIKVGKKFQFIKTTLEANQLSIIGTRMTAPMKDGPVFFFNFFFESFGNSTYIYFSMFAMDVK